MKDQRSFAFYVVIWRDLNGSVKSNVLLQGSREFVPVSRAFLLSEKHCLDFLAFTGFVF